MKRYKDFINEGNVGMGSLHYAEYPYQYNVMDNPTDRGEEGNIEFYKKNNNFQLIQDEIKNIIVSNHPKYSNDDVENMLHKFFSLGDYKNQDIRSISDNCKNIKKCASEIYNKYIKIVQINYGKDDTNDVQQDF